MKRTAARVLGIMFGLCAVGCVVPPEATRPVAFAAGLNVAVQTKGEHLIPGPVDTGILAQPWPVETTLEPDPVNGGFVWVARIKLPGPEVVVRTPYVGPLGP